MTDPTPEEIAIANKAADSFSDHLDLKSKYVCSYAERIILRYIILSAMRQSADAKRLDWQPIATAPKEHLVLVFRPSGRICIAGYNRQEFHKNPSPYWEDYGPFGVISMRADSPTHWMPLPSAPIDAAKEAGR